MQPIQSVIPQQMSLLKGTSLGQGQPETGEFNFMNYLLGLQGSQTPTTLESLLASEVTPPKQGPADPSRDPLQAMFAAIPMPSLNPVIAPDFKMVNPALPQGETALATLDAVKPQLVTSDLMSQGEKTAESVLSLTDRAVGETQVLKVSGKSEETGIPLQGFDRVNEQMGMDLPISRQDQAMAAKKYGAHNAKSELESSAKPNSVAPVAPAARPQVEDAVEASASPTLSVAMPSKPKSETTSTKEGVEAGGSNVNDFSQATLAAHKAEVAGGAVEAKAMNGPAAVGIPEVFQRVETLVRQGGGEMTVALDPPDLGKIEVKVTTRGNRVEIEMRSESIHTKAALEGHFSELKSAMQSHDLHLAKLDVQVRHDSASFAGQSFTGMADGRNAGGTQGGPNQGQGRQFSETNRKLTGASFEPQVVARATNPMAGNGRVDMRI